MKLQNKGGFTLLEIIIVIIIIGVLASLALPRLFSTVEYSRSAEALSTIASIRSSVERCYLQTNNYANCNTLGSLDIDNPTSAPNYHFTYGIAGSANGYSITATRDATNDPNPAATGNLISLRVSGGGIDKCGTGAYKAIGNTAACGATGYAAP